MSRFLKNVLLYTLIWGLMVAILFAVIVSAIITLPGLLRELYSHVYGSSEFVNAVNSDELKYLSSFIVGSAALVALLTYMREKKRIGREHAERRSRFFFEQASAGLEEVYNLLKDQNNDRIIWLRAARDLLHSINLSKQIFRTEFKEAYRLAEEKIRHKLYLVLSICDGETKERNALPPQFFYGLKDWQVERSLDDAAKLASQKIVAHKVTIDKVLHTPTTLSLAEVSVVAIYDFLEYPKKYKDPVNSVAVWRGHWDFGQNIGLGIDQGARRFIYHKLQHNAIDGELYKNEIPDERAEPKEN